jgi:hypothetical protein
MIPTADADDCVRGVPNLRLIQLPDLRPHQTVFRNVDYCSPKPAAVAMIFIVPPSKPEFLKDLSFGWLIAGKSQRKVLELNVPLNRGTWVLHVDTKPLTDFISERTDFPLQSVAYHQIASPLIVVHWKITRTRNGPA